MNVFFQFLVQLFNRLDEFYVLLIGSDDIILKMPHRITSGLTLLEINLDVQSSR